MTGGASGIGLSISTLMAKEGAKVVIADFNEAGALISLHSMVKIIFVVMEWQQAYSLHLRSPNSLQVKRSR
ncbi:hypothetical protein ABEW06_06170 [Peribacillus simplex]